MLWTTHLSLVAALLAPPQDPHPVKQTWTIDNRQAFILKPAESARREGALPWVWYAPTLSDAYPSSEESWMFDRFRDAGVAIAGIDAGESYGSPEGCALFQKFYQELTSRRGFGVRPVLLARSRGGLMLYNWAADHPECVAAIAGIYPVCALESYPGLKKASGAYGMSAQELQDCLSQHNPIDRLAGLASHRVPLFHLHGDEDRVVPLEENSARLASRYRALGGPIVVEVIEGQGHNLWSGWFESEKLTEFVISCARHQWTDASTLSKKVMVGYQGWFNCDGDGAELGWKHWARDPRRDFGPGNVTVDLWPDVSELDQDERFPTAFQSTDGTPAEVFSSAHPKTVLRHFRWMRDYGIDGAFVQRFVTALSKPQRRANVDRVLGHAREGAFRFGRSYAVMYDLSGLKEGEARRAGQDWARISKHLKLEHDPGYMRHKGRPLVGVWGIGFKDRAITLEEGLALIDSLKERGAAILLGVPSFWREGIRDAVEHELFQTIVAKADVVSPWSVGRYQTSAEAQRHAKSVWRQDKALCQERDQAFLPVVFPGFSWHNLKGGALDQIPRQGGSFFWSQIEAVHELGCDMVYLAMFDEVDEGTALFKCTNHPPAGSENRFLTFEGLPSDHYLKLAGKASRLLRGSLSTPR